MNRERVKRPRIFYGYWLVLVTFIFTFLAIGCGSFAFSLFVTPLQETLGWSRGQIMLAFTIFFVTMGLVSPFVGRVADRRGARLVIPLGGVVMGLGFVVVSRMSDLWLFYLGYVLVGSGAAGMGQVPCSVVISHWFKKRRGTAIGLMAAGVGAGGILAPLISAIMTSQGWRAAYMAMAVMIWALVIPLGSLVVRTRPSEMGMYPDGEPIPPGAALEPPAALSGIPLSKAATTSTFILIALSFFAGSFASMGLVQAPVPFLQDIGFPILTAAAALSAVGIGSGLGKIIFGWLCDKMHPRFGWAIGQAMMAISVVVLLGISAESSSAPIWAYALLAGFGMGAWLPTLSILASRNFGLAYYGAVFGALNLVQSSGTATGPYFAGLMYDALGTYYWTFATYGVMLLIGIPLILMARKPSRIDS